MCGRFAQVIKDQEIRAIIKETKAVITDEQIEISFNVAPTHTVMAIVSKEELRYNGFFRWGLIPSWMLEMPKSPMINVRAETIHEKPSFKASFLRRRSVVPVNGFYEWRQADKTPFYIYPKDGLLFYLATIYDIWEDDKGSYIPSLGIVTTEANQKMSALHHRMPALLKGDALDKWLNPKVQDKYELLKLLKPAPDEFIQYYEVSRKVNKVQNNHPNLLSPLNDALMNPL